MSKLDEVKCIIELEKEKSDLEGQLACVKKQINILRQSCSHIVVDLGYSGMHQNIDNKCYCLLCGMKEKEYIYYPEYIVHAEDYLPEYDIKDDEQRIAKFELLRTLTIGILKDNPKISNQELVFRLNNLIQESTSVKQSKDNEIQVQKLVKTINPKN